MHAQNLLCKRAFSVRRNRLKRHLQGPVTITSVVKSFAVENINTCFNDFAVSDGIRIPDVTLASRTLLNCAIE